MSPTLIIFAHGSGIGKGRLPLPESLVVSTYANTFQNIDASDARLIFENLTRKGKASQTIGHLTEHQYTTQMPNFPLNFDDHNQVGEATGTPLGLYYIREDEPGKLEHVDNPWEGRRVHVQEVANRYAQGCSKIVLVSCNGAPSVTVVGHHTGRPVKRDGSSCSGQVQCVCDIGSAGSFEDLNMAPFVCSRCGYAFEPTSFSFKSCLFKFEGTRRPRGETFSLGPGGMTALDKTWIDCTQTTMDVSLRPVAGAIMTLRLQTKLS